MVKKCTLVYTIARDSVVGIRATMVQRGELTQVESTVASSELSAAQQPRTGIFSGRQGRRRKEALLAYAFLFPAFLIVGLFGIFPLIFASYQSTLRGLNKINGNFDGLFNYVKAIDDLAYVLFFWLAALLVFLAIRTLVRADREAKEERRPFWLWALPGIAIGLGIALFILFIFRVLPPLLEVPSQMRGQGSNPQLFRQLAFEAFLEPQVQIALWSSIVALLAGVAAQVYISHHMSPSDALHGYMGQFVSATVMFIGAVGLTWLTWSYINEVYADAMEQGESLDIWTQMITISAGFLLLLVAWWLWGSASHRDSNIGTAMRLGGAAMLLVGAWVLIGELPRVIAAGDSAWWYGILATFYYAAGTIPLQLGISLILATFLFQDVWGKAGFRIVYFLPYIAPIVGTAAVFRIIFSSRPTAPINALMIRLGMNPQAWLNDPEGIFQMMLGNTVSLPHWASGPSLALVVVIIYGTWTFIGFNTVIFMAGLGSIPRELYEAAAIDGAGRWPQFRHITLPLLSPTIYFLTLYSVIGTFKAFNHIYVLRTGAALGTTDTASVVIFQAFKRDTRFGYASALAILLLLIILVLTAVNNRLASKRVFYG